MRTVLALILVCVCSSAFAQTSFPSYADVRRVELLEARVAAIEAVLNTQKSLTAVNSFNLAPGETLEAVNGVPVRKTQVQKQTYAFPSTISRHVQVPSFQFNSFRTCPPGGCK